MAISYNAVAEDKSNEKIEVVLENGSFENDFGVIGEEPSITITSPEPGYLYFFKLQPILE